MMADTGAIDTSNSIFKKAVSFVNDTNEHLFITGKAGTGKTTFLKHVRETTRKQCAIVAPTGVAAINAGGETIHSFLQLPFSPFVPGTNGFGKAGHAEDKHSLLANLRLRETKLNLLRKLELLIIDEVSMVRCDLLDAMDLVLRHVRKNWSRPFGGVQMVFIGDLFQLPPVVPQDDWEILRSFYSSPYFFDAHALRETPPVYIELKKIYRQKEQAFIDILNRVRNGEPKHEDINTLNTLYDPTPRKESGYIMLCTHNRIADDINQQSLDALPATPHSFEGVIKNEFNPKNLPTEQVLQLKVNAQIMFVKNDVQHPRRYYNGKIATVSAIDNAGIWVTFPGESAEPLLVEQETWKNMRYTLNGQTGNIEEEESGSFTQYPIRLAWAVTVHKSQGLTLQKAIVDLSQSFAPGQVYVALSRCTTMEGLVLRSKLAAENVIVDQRVIDFARSEHDEEELDGMLEQSTREASAAKLCKVFSFDALIEKTEQVHMELLKPKTGPKEKNSQLNLMIENSLRKAQAHATAFHKQIHLLTLSEEYDKLNERKSAAAAYFTEQVLAPCRKGIDDHVQEFAKLPRLAKQMKLWKSLESLIKQKESEIAGCCEPVAQP